MANATTTTAACTSGAGAAATAGSSLLVMERRRELINRELSVFLATGLGGPAIARRAANPGFCAQLVDALLDGTVYSIVESLRDLQTLRDRELFNQRQSRVLECQHDSPAGLAERIREIDRDIVRATDEIVREQQSMLICSGMPGFRSTDDPAQLQFQMGVVKFVLSLGHVYDGCAAGTSGGQGTQMQKTTAIAATTMTTATTLNTTAGRAAAH